MVYTQIVSYRWKMDSSTNLLHKLTSSDAVCMGRCNPGSGVIPATRTFSSLSSPVSVSSPAKGLTCLGSTLDVVLTIIPLCQQYCDFTCCCIQFATGTEWCGVMVVWQEPPLPPRFSCAQSKGDPAAASLLVNLSRTSSRCSAWGVSKMFPDMSNTEDESVAALCDSRGEPSYIHHVRNRTQSRPTRDTSHLLASGSRVLSRSRREGHSSG
jgi:hypothetical protein